MKGKEFIDKYLEAKSALDDIERSLKVLRKNAPMLGDITPIEKDTRPTVTVLWRAYKQFKEELNELENTCISVGAVGTGDLNCTSTAELLEEILQRSGNSIAMTVNNTLVINVDLPQVAIQELMRRFKS